MKQTMGVMIAALRKERGMTQAELAEKMNVTDKAVSKWERDLSCPDINALPRLAELFDLSVDELLQAKHSAGTLTLREKIEGIITLVLKALTVAMGVSVLVLSILGKADAHTEFSLLGIGLTSAGICLLRNGG